MVILITVYVFVLYQLLYQNLASEMVAVYLIFGMCHVVIRSYISCVGTQVMLICILLTLFNVNLYKKFFNDIKHQLNRIHLDSRMTPAEIIDSLRRQSAVLDKYVNLTRSLQADSRGSLSPIFSGLLVLQLVNISFLLAIFIGHTKSLKDDQQDMDSTMGGMIFPLYALFAAVVVLPSLLLNAASGVELAANLAQPTKHFQTSLHTVISQIETHVLAINPLEAVVISERLLTFLPSVAPEVMGGNGTRVGIAGHGHVINSLMQVKYFIECACLIALMLSTIQI